MSTLGTKIQMARIAAGLTVDEVAAMIGKNRATVYRYEKDEVEMPLSVIGPLAIALKTSPAYLMGWQEEKPINDADDGLSEIAMIFSSLSPDNRAKFLELGRLYLASQRNKD